MSKIKTTKLRRFARRISCRESKRFFIVSTILLLFLVATAGYILSKTIKPWYPRNYSYTIPAGPEGLPLNNLFGSSRVLAANSYPSYESQYIIERIRVYSIQTRYDSDWLYADPDYPKAGYKVADIAVGPSSWLVRHCVGGTISGGSETSLGTCSGEGVTTIDERWSVTAWAKPSNFPAINDKIQFKVESYSASASSTGDNRYVDLRALYVNGTCEGKGFLMRSGLYGISFENASGCDGNYAGGWWSYSEIPTAWQVTRL